MSSARKALDQKQPHALAELFLAISADLCLLTFGLVCTRNQCLGHEILMEMTRRHFKCTSFHDLLRVAWQKFADVSEELCYTLGTFLDVTSQMIILFNPASGTNLTDFTLNLYTDQWSPKYIPHATLSPRNSLRMVWPTAKHCDMHTVLLHQVTGVDPWLPHSVTCTCLTLLIV
jgi:hypothetical protein